MPSTNRRRFLKQGLGSVIVAGVTSRLGEAVQEKEPMTTTSVTSFPFFRAEGTHRQLGRQHGEQAVEHIKAHLDYLRESMKLSRDELQDRALRFRPLFQQHCPHLLDEIEGLAQGAGITLAEALAVNIRGALNSVQDEGCTAYAIGARGTAAGSLLIGQNSDMLPAAIDFAYVLTLKPVDKPQVLMWTFGGMIGYHGLNSLGVAHFANDLGGGPKPRFGMPPLSTQTPDAGMFDDPGGSRVVTADPTVGQWKLCGFATGLAKYWISRPRRRERSWLPTKALVSWPTRTILSAISSLPARIMPSLRPIPFNDWSGCSS